MKKIFLLATAVTMLALFAACSTTPQQGTSESTKVTENVGNENLGNNNVAVSTDQTIATTTPKEEDNPDTGAGTTQVVETIEPTPAKYRLEGDTLICYGGTYIDLVDVSEALFEHGINKEDLKGVIVEDGITSIENYTFRWYSGLTDITLADSVIELGANTFEGTPWLEKKISSGGTIIVGKVLYRVQEKIYGEYVVPEGIKGIAENAFKEQTNMTSIVLPESLIAIGNYAFMGCPISAISLPENLTTIGNYAFERCQISTISLPEGLTTIGGCAFASCPISTISLPESLSYIGGAAFSSCNLTSITIPEGITEINSSTFYNCDMLTNVILPESLIVIDEAAFESCDNLISITIPESVEYIGPYAFKNCSSLTSITLPKNLKLLGGYVFVGCSGLTDITVPESARSQDGHTFDGCENITIHCTAGSSMETTLKKNGIKYVTD